MVIHLNNLNPHHLKCSVLSLVEIRTMVLEILKKNVNRFLLFPNNIPLKKRVPSFEQTLVLSTTGCFMPRLVEICPVVLEKKMKMWKNLQKNGQTDNKRQAIRKAYLNFKLR